MLNILITGGAGYLGTTLAPMLLDRGHRVAVFDSLHHGVVPILPLFRREGFTFCKGDIRDRDALERFAASADAIIHLAAIVGYPACSKWPQDASTINIDGTRNVADIAGKGRPVVFASTSSCYGAVPDGICTEDTPLHPLSLYGTSKAQGEQMLLDQCTAVVYRLATAYGLSPRLRLDLLVNDFVYRSLHEGRLVIYEGQARRSFIHVTDIARALTMAVENPAPLAGRVYNVGDESQNHTKLELCRIIQRQIPSLQIVPDDTGRDVDKRDYVVSYARIRSAGFKLSVALEDGIAELAKALRWIDRPETFANVQP